MNLLRSLSWVVLCSLGYAQAFSSFSYGARPWILDVRQQQNNPSHCKRSKVALYEKSKLIPTIAARRPSFQSGLRYRSDDWFKNFLSLPNSYVLRRIRFHLFTNVALSVLVVMVHSLTQRCAIPLTGHSLMGGFLSLLLVFRTNTAYARFYEARGIWTGTKTACRNFSFTVATYMHSPQSAAKLQAQLTAFPKALLHTCMAGGVQLPESVKEQLPQIRTTSITPALLLCAEMHKTLHHAAKESTTIKEDRIEALHLNHMSHFVDKLVGSVTSCEKILRTPVPWSYSRHTSRFLTLWAGTLPFALVDSLGWFTVPVVTAACWCLFGIEEIGHLIEQPFGGLRRTRAHAYDFSLPIQQFATQIEAEVTYIATMSTEPAHLSSEVVMADAS